MESLAIALLRGCLNSQTSFEVSHRTCKQVFLVSVLSLLTGLSHLIFFGVPPPLQPVEGGGSVKGGKRNS
jgi:hypothetical protein